MQKLTQNDQVFRGLRREILSCQMMPSTKIKINQVCQRYGVSLGAGREALSRLVADGLVVLEPQKGFSVAPVSAKELRDMTEARIALEALCIEQAINQGDAEWESKIIAASQQLNSIPERSASALGEVNEEWSELHAEFHSALVAACSNMWLLRMRDMLYAQSERYRQWSVSLGTALPERNVAQEHERIMRAVLARDIAAASSAIADHFNKTTEMVLRTSQEMALEIA